MIRPEIQQAAWRARELLAGAMLIVLGLWASLGSFGLLRWIGVALVVIGLATAFTGVQRLRLRPNGPGLGAIETDEGKLTYWGPLNGGTVDIDDLIELAIDTGNRPITWVLSDQQGTTLYIPTTATGHDALLDWLSSLPGLSTARLANLLAQARATPPERRVVWTRPANTGMISG